MINQGHVTWSCTRWTVNGKAKVSTPFTPTVTTNGTTITAKNGSATMFYGIMGVTGAGGSWSASNIPTNGQTFTYAKDAGS